MVLDPDLVSLLTVGGLLALATLVSEDLACITAGALVAEGRIGFLPATLACFIGILGGDLLLFLAGRSLGRPLLAVRIVRSALGDGAVQRSTAWLDRRGAAIVLASRFIPGTRLATCVAAGALGSRPWAFAGWFALAAALWTPLIVGAATVVETEVARSGILAGSALGWRIALVAIALAILWRLAHTALSWPARRRALACWRRWTRWEFWPRWLFYPPVVAWIAWLGVRHRGLTVFSAANPGIPGGGFVGESKFDILQALGMDHGDVARAVLVPAAADAAQRLRLARRFLQAHGLELPVVLKPDQGQRGDGVAIVKTLDDLHVRLAEARSDMVLQEYVPGIECGVFYYRRPSAPRGRIFSVTEKRFPQLVGDGRRTIDALILADDRAVCLEGVHRRAHAADLDRVPGRGERVDLVEVGSHCRGSIFLDGGALVTPAMEEAFDAIARRFDGFFFGRFDVRAPSLDDMRAGTRLKVIELNGVTSEATSIYDPGRGLLDAYRTLFAQWRLAFEIGAENRRRGARVWTIGELARMVRAYRARARVTAGAPAPDPRRPAWQPTGGQQGGA
jgi:membrane protein DedA with SNARE-associated domain